MHSQRVGFFIRACALAWVLCGSAAMAGPSWHQKWGNELFTEAARTHRLVLLDLKAVWCHWCHVMEETTYQDQRVQGLLAQHFVIASVDADSDPALTSRYGNWGWPATIVLAGDGSEIVKRRGYVPPAQFASLLQAIVDDPTPGPWSIFRSLWSALPRLRWERRRSIR
jgi:thiol:disulfide interchange protein